jgi:sugar (pentulose or hexulose) kinase
MRLKLDLLLKGFSLQVYKLVDLKGGASQNQSILQICSDIFGVTVYPADTNPNSAALGCAYRGCAALEKISISDIIPIKISRPIAIPRSEYLETYQKLIIKQGEIETQMLDNAF